MKKTIIFVVTMVFLLNPLLISLSNAQGEAVPFITLPDGTAISMTSAQLSALAACPGVVILASPDVGVTEVSIPIPAALGGGYLVGTPAAIASCLNSTGIATGVVASAIVGATASAGVIPAGALAGLVAGLGTGGTLAAGSAVAAGITSLFLLSTGGGGGGGATHHPVK